MALFGLGFIIFVFLIVLVIAIKRKSAVLVYLCGLYLFSCVVGLSFALEWKKEFSFLSSLIFVITILFYFLPYLKKTPQIGGMMNRASIKRFSFVGYGIVIVLLTGDALLTSKILDVAATGFAETRIQGYIENNMTFTMTEHIGHSILRWFSGLSYLLIIMFFYAMAFIPKHRLLKLLLIVGSLSAGYFGLCSGGRTRLMYWFLFFVIAYIIFSSYLSKKGRRVIRASIFVFSSIIATFFVIISLLRSGLQGLDTIEWLSAYAGQPIVNFCEYFDRFNHPSYTLYRVLPLTSSIIMGRFDLSSYRDYILSKTGLEINGFNTMIGDFYIDTGLLGMILISVLYYVVSQKVMKQRILNFQNLCLLTILLQIPIHGLFYYSLWQMESSVCSIMTLLFGMFVFAPMKKIKEYEK